jgi:hypothetical protein
MPSGKPGKFSTSVVNISCPPGCIPAKISGFRRALAVYIPAVYPAGPDPKIITFLTSIVILVNHSGRFEGLTEKLNLCKSNFPTNF